MHLKKKKKRHGGPNRENTNFRQRGIILKLVCHHLVSCWCHWLDETLCVRPVCSMRVRRLKKKEGKLSVAVKECNTLRCKPRNKTTRACHGLAIQEAHTSARDMTAMQKQCGGSASLTIRWLLARPLASKAMPRHNTLQREDMSSWAASTTSRNEGTQTYRSYSLLTHGCAS